MRTEEAFNAAYKDLLWHINFHKKPFWLVPTETGYSVSAVAPTLAEIPRGCTAKLVGDDEEILDELHSSRSGLFIDLQSTSHPLKWKWLVKQVQEAGLENPDIWIEDLRRYGCSEEPEIVHKSEDTDAVSASFSPIIDREKNRITIRHHF